MSDRELMELAAKAAGIAGEYKREYQAYGNQWIDGIDYGGRLFWNPLTDDGDALRLAVMLRMDIEYDENKVGTWFSVPRPGLDITQSCYEMEQLGADPYAATRRAIVRAAAEIGKTLTGENRNV